MVGLTRSHRVRPLVVRSMRIPLAIVLLIALTGCTPPAITKKEYDGMCKKAVNLHNTLAGQVRYQGSKMAMTISTLNRSVPFRIRPALSKERLH